MPRKKSDRLELTAKSTHGERLIQRFFRHESASGAMPMIDLLDEQLDCSWRS
jgi:hypothetical protein